MIHPVVRVVNAAEGIVVSEPRRARVAIIGAGAGRDLAPYDDLSWECWAINEIPQRRYDRHFELHPMSVQSARDLRVLAAISAPCYVLKATPLVPAGVVYPLNRVLAAGLRDYFACTFAYQIALALVDGFEELGLWGVELYRGSPRERLVERACVEYWLGVAEGRGIRVSEDSGLAHQPYRYGYDYDAEVRFVQGEVDRFSAVARLF